MAAFERGQPQIDSHLLDKAGDQRRGVSLNFPLAAPVQAAIKPFLDLLAADFPGQYFYEPEELHVTIVTLISATEHWQQEFNDVDAFRGILREVLSRHGPFKVEFRGVTAARNAVLIQGFPVGDTLENVRGDLRRTFVARGFPNRLDRRYPNSAAHATVMRFCKTDSDWKRLAAILKTHRQTPFGEMRVDTLQLTFGDWYASAGTMQVLEEFRL